MNESPLTIDELARASGVTTRTIRFYCQQKLLPPPVAMKGRVALYGQEHVSALKVIKALKEQYFLPLDFIRQILAKPEKLSGLEHHLRLNQELLDLLGFQSSSLTGGELARRSGLSKADVDKLVVDGWLEPSEGERALLFTVNDLKVAQHIKSLFRLGFKVEELDFIPPALEHLAKLFFELGHEKMHSGMFEKVKQKSKRGAVVEDLIKVNRELTSLVYQEFLRRQIKNHHAAKMQKKASDLSGRNQGK